MNEKLYEVRNGLSNVINELERISQGVRSDFKGVGEDECANSLQSIVIYYRLKLKRIDQELSTKGFTSGGGTFGGGGGGGSF